MESFLSYRGGPRTGLRPTLNLLNFLTEESIWKNFDYLQVRIFVIKYLITIGILFSQLIFLFVFL